MNQTLIHGWKVSTFNEEDKKEKGSGGTKNKVDGISGVLEAGLPQLEVEPHPGQEENPMNRRRGLSRGENKRSGARKDGKLVVNSILSVMMAEVWRWRCRCGDSVGCPAWLFWNNERFAGR